VSEEKHRTQTGQKGIVGALGGYLRWDIASGLRAYIVGFTGINFSGQRIVVDIWPHGGRQSGDEELDGRRLKSIGLIAPLGTRMTIMTAATPDNWEVLPWRCIQVLEGHTFDSVQFPGFVGAQVPDLDFVDSPSALRTDPDFNITYPQVERFEDGEGWTFGRVGAMTLKTNIRSIRVDKV